MTSKHAMQPKLPSLDDLNAHLETLAAGKPTEATQLRLNQHDFHLLELADQIARRKGYRSRHAWLVEAVMNRATELLGEQYDPAPRASFED